jgi:hypothetical protein
MGLDLEARARKDPLLDPKTVYFRMRALILPVTAFQQNCWAMT